MKPGSPYSITANQRCGAARVSVVADSDDRVVSTRAEALAEKLGLPFAGTVAAVSGETDLILAVTDDRLELRDARRRAAGPVFVDFLHGPSGFRRRSDLSRRQPIATAIGLRSGPVAVVDATAGLARDSFLLASLGCTVVAVERSTILGAMIRDGMSRAAAKGSAAVSTVLDRLTLVVDDARVVLGSPSRAALPDVVYIDPMYPPRKKTALPKKEMLMCRRLVGDDGDSAELLAVARLAATRRVVVKRPRYAPPLAPNPTIRFKGKQVRYDVYSTSARMPD